MSVQFTHPDWLWLAPAGLGWVIYWGLRSDVSIGPFRRGSVFVLRLLIVSMVILALAGLQRKKKLEGMNVLFLLDQSQSIPAEQQKEAINYINQVSAAMDETDKAGLIVFGSYPGIEFNANKLLEVERIHAVVATDRTDLAAAIRLGTAALPETGQKRLVLLTDANENLGDAVEAALASRPLDVSIDIVPLGAKRGGDVVLKKVGVPTGIKEGQTFDVKIFAESDQAQEGTVRLYRNDQLLGEQAVSLSQGKNLFTFPQTLDDPDFYEYQVQLDVVGDVTPQNNKAANFINVKGDPRILVVSSQPDEDASLVEALQQSQLYVQVDDISGLPSTLAEIQSYDSLILSNIAAGDLALSQMRLIQSAVRDFGVGLVCIGGDQAFAAGAYRGTPLEEALPLDMDLSSKKVLPKGALVLVMHGMEFNNGNQYARDIALGVLDALGPQDELGVVLWDGTERWLFDLTPVGDKAELGRKIAGMNQGDLPHFEGVMKLANEALKASTANLKHMIVFSDGDPGAPSSELMTDIVNNRITVSSVLIAGHAGPQTMMAIASDGGGRFYDIQNPAMLPQVFIKETAVILKSAINEEPFKPALASVSEPIRGVDVAGMPMLHGYVATSIKPRAEVPLLTHKGDPLLAHWQYGLGRAVAFTSDARAKWAREWIGWGDYQQFWSQLVNWSLRKIEEADFSTALSIEDGQGIISVEALDAEGNFRNFLNLETTVVGPSGKPENILLEQKGPGRYEARFPTRETGAYFLSLMDIENGRVRGMQRLGASVNYSPEFNASKSNDNLMLRLTQIGEGKMLDKETPEESPFKHDRVETFQSEDLWEWLLKAAVILFPIDVGIRRIYVDREEWLRLTMNLRKLVGLGRRESDAVSQASMAALLSRKGLVKEKFKSKAEAGSVRSDLFAAKQQATSVAPSTEKAAAEKQVAETPKAQSVPSNGDKTKPTKASATKDRTTSRLLEARERARRKRDL